MMNVPMIYHETEHGTIYCGDSLDVLSGMADESVDCCITSPPYDNLRDYKGYSFDFEGIANQLFRVIKQGGVVVWIVGDATVNGSETGTSFRQALHFKEIGFNIHDTMIYLKDGTPFPESNRYSQIFEYMFVLSKGKLKTFNPIKRKTTLKNIKKNPATQTCRKKDGSLSPKQYEMNKSEMIQYNVWQYGVGYMKSAKDKYIFQHPAIFPEQLAVDHILSWSNSKEIILDPFFGSGTVGAMAVRYGRRYIGIDISEEYCAIAAKRIDSELRQANIFREMTCR